MKNIKTKYQKYPEYKDSGVEWLGEIPVGWEVKPGLSFISESKEKNTGMKLKTVLSLSYGNIRVKKEEELTGLVPESFETYQIVEVGDLIFRPTDLQNDHVSLRSSISNYRGIITSAYLNLRFNKNIHSKFYHYFFRAIDNNKVIYGLGSGLRQNIDYRDFRRFKFILPPLPEQTAIANFLDDKTAKIDRAVAQKEKLIALLKERKQIIIQNAVTKGLNPNVKLKDSGVEWIGDIPEHWEVKRLKYVATVLMGQSPESRYVNQNGKGLAFLQGNAEFGRIHPKEKNWCDHPKKIALTNDILYSVRAPVGEVNIADKKYCIGRGLCSISNFNIHQTYLLYGSILFKQELDKYSTGSTFDAISTLNIKNILLPIPPLSEQKQIVAYIEEQSAKIDKAISLQQKQIEKLKEYKTVLIDSAVTGKIKVLNRIKELTRRTR